MFLFLERNNGKSTRRSTQSTPRAVETGRTHVPCPMFARELPLHKLAQREMTSLKKCPREYRNFVTQ